MSARGRFDHSLARYVRGVLVAGLVAGLSCGGASTALAVTPSVSAMNVGTLNSLPQTTLNRQLAAVQKARVTVVRDDASWGTIEPNPPGAGGDVYQFGFYDSLVKAFASHHLTWLPILDYSAPWAGSVAGDWRSPPASDTECAHFAAAVAARYGVGGTFWSQNPKLPYEPVTMFEVWNEENLGYFWDTGPDPAGYAHLYLAARSAIRAVNPGAQVIVGGLTYAGDTSNLSGRGVADPDTAQPVCRHGDGDHPGAHTAHRDQPHRP